MTGTNVAIAIIIVVCVIVICILERRAQKRNREKFLKKGEPC